MGQSERPLLQVDDLRTYFFTTLGTVRAVDGLSFSVPPQRILGIVGESGCGKSVAARSILGIVPPPGRIVSGSMRFRSDGGELDLATLDPHDEAFRHIRGREIAMIFQEPMSALSPVHTVGNQLIEALIIYDPKLTKDDAGGKCVDLLRMVGIPSPETLIDVYIFELSGGMRQRVLVAMAISGNPKLLMADEPTTAIDVTTQAKVLDLLRELHGENRMSMLFITHNMGVIAELADEVIVMYLGSVAERGPVVEIFDRPKHPYTQALLESIPGIGVTPKTELRAIEGSVPDPYRRPPGCPFSNRCPSFMPDTCDTALPPLYRTEAGHDARCFLYEGSEVVEATPATQPPLGAQPPEASGG
jgi:peptide/nickel transport system ATP-binding protein